MKFKIKRIVIFLHCWWFGCEPDNENAVFNTGEYSYGWRTPCKHCNITDVDYADLVGDTRHNRFKEWCKYYLFRKWWPEKCADCGHRYKCDDEIMHDTIPF